VPNNLAVHSVDLDDLAGVANRLDNVDKRVNEINRQAMALLNTETGAFANGC
jgi:tetrahydromethanopterin S-methyltransferase subunit G